MKLAVVLRDNGREVGRGEYEIPDAYLAAHDDQRAELIAAGLSMCRHPVRNLLRAMEAGRIVADQYADVFAALARR